MKKALQELKKRDSEIMLLNHAAETLRWDQETYMPPKALPQRADQISLLQGMIHEKVVEKSNAGLFAECGLTATTPNGPAESDDIERAFLRESFKRFSKQTKVPKTLVTELAHTQSIAQANWIEAKKTADYNKFKPYLSKLLGLLQQYAECMGYEDEIYDALLDDYEPYAKTKETEKLFDSLKDSLVPLLAKIVEKRKSGESDIIQRSFPVAKQEEFNNQLLAAMGFDLSRGRMDVSAHPFTTTLGGHDVRLTTRYNEHFFPSSVFGTIHEAGHGLYELGMGEKLSGSLLANGTSLGIHESQSRLWENLVGRSRAFWEGFYPGFKSLFHDALNDVPLDDFYHAVNSVSPSLIRVEADEVTYNLHIILRFNLERKLLSQDLSVDDLPEAWNIMSKELLGIMPANDSEGVLQDVHWSMGALGYFPTYTLGNLYGSQFYDTMKQAHPDIEKQIKNKNLLTVKQWLADNIHVHGSVYPAGELVQRVTGKPLDPQYFTRYITAKYGALYDL